MRRPKNWVPNESEKQRLLAFEGYGADSAEVVFVGLEEYCSNDPNQQRDSIWIRCTHSEFASKRADKNRALEALSGLVKTHVPVWDVMAGIEACRSFNMHPTLLTPVTTKPIAASLC